MRELITRILWRATFACITALFLLAGGPLAQSSEVDELRERLEKLEAQNAALQKKLLEQTNQGVSIPAGSEAGGGSLTTKDVQEMIRAALKEEADKKQQAEDTNKGTEAAKKRADEEWKEVGKDLKMNAVWKHGLWLETDDGAFKVHVGGRTQFDIVTVTAPENVMNGTGGIGPYNDGINFRRARLAIEGTFWEVLDFNCEYDFLNTFDDEPLTPHRSTPATVANTPVPTDLWITITHLPFIGNIRFGNHKPWIGFEHMTSSRFLNFMERSYQFDAFIEDGNNGFSPGISMFNTYGHDDNGMWGLGVWKTTRNIFGWNQGDNEWSLVGRITWLPIYQDDGRYLLHVGLGASYRDLDDGQLRLRSRTLIRNSNAVLHNIVAIAQVQGDTQLLLNPELVANIGPLTIQSEYIHSWTSSVNKIIRTPTQNNVNITSRTYEAQGYYVEVLYFLTGEHRRYNKKIGSFDRVIPFRNYFWVNDENHCHLFQSGAWQLAFRYSYLDLNNNGINGGQLNDFTAGINWFLNPNCKFQWNYSYGYRKVDGTATGSYQGFGTTVRFDF